MRKFINRVNQIHAERMLFVGNKITQVHVPAWKNFLEIPMKDVGQNVSLILIASQIVRV